MLLKRYAVVFTGELAEGVSRDKARQVLAQKYGIKGPQLDKIFCGKRVIIKRGVDRGSGLVLMNKFKSAGMVCKLVEMNTPPQSQVGAGMPLIKDKEYDWPEPPPPASGPDKGETEPAPQPDAGSEAVEAIGAMGAVKASKTAEPAREQQPAPRKDDSIPAPDAAAVVPAVLRRHGPKKGAYPGLEVPPDRFKNALSNCFLSGDDTIYGVLDVSGDCSSSLVFTNDGINCGFGDNTGFITYRDYLELKIALENKTRVALGEEHTLVIKKGAPMSAKQYALFLLQLQEELIKSMMKAAK